MKISNNIFWVGVEGKQLITDWAVQNVTSQVCGCVCMCYLSVHLFLVLSLHFLICCVCFFFKYFTNPSLFILFCVQCLGLFLSLPREVILVCPSLFVLLNLKFCFIILSVLPLDWYVKLLVRTQVPDLVSFDSICVIF